MYDHDTLFIRSTTTMNVRDEKGAAELLVLAASMSISITCNWMKFKFFVPVDSSLPFVPWLLADVESHDSSRTLRAVYLQRFFLFFC